MPDLRRRAGTFLLGAGLLAAVLLAWNRLAAGGGGDVASLGEVGGVLTGRRDLLAAASAVTLREAALGLLAGAVLATVAAWVARTASGARGPLQHMMLIFYAIPLVALGPLLTASVERDAIPVIAAAISVALPVFSAAEAGLGTVSEGLRDLLTVNGAGRWSRLVLLEAPGALPYVIEGIKFAVPGALLGALIGEWFGSEQGLGVLLVSGLREGQADLVGAVSVLVVVVSSAVYALFSRLARTVQRRRGITGSAA
ncbi:ABC transporter permease [Sphaerisporangium corydalis]|uniref:ABC transporter permease n=1 Tax=Sphaerisporangium corydalis TaxID=1441875 RepID=A0ABV9ECK8_9ACTN|nr:ABC transporter permease subunit [Sphaerisporangium corydalis]